MTLEEFYRVKLNFVPENLKKGLGHFNVFKVDDCMCGRKKSVPYSRKDYYKITLLKGKYNIQYADRTLETSGNALVFSNPMIPYTWESLDDFQTGFFCIFTEEFFSQYGNLKEYPMFKPGFDKVFILNNEQAAEVEKLYQRMFEEINSGFEYKFDVIRGLVFNLIHDALRMQPAHEALNSSSNATSRITTMFAELLERQFPVETSMQRIKLRSPIDFAEHLAVHVNHLNRSLKETTGKTTSQLITERVTQEARVLLRHTDWNISEIGYSLGFEESSHFVNFFRKNNGESPKTYRDRVVV